MDYSWPSHGAPDDGVIAVDALGRIDYVNAAATAMFGYGERELLGQSLEVLLPDCRVAAHARRRRARAAVGEGALLRSRSQAVAGRRRDGTDLPLHLVLKPDAESGRVFVFLHRRGRPFDRAERMDAGGFFALPDRHDLHRDLDARLAPTAPGGNRACLLFIEIDPFAGSRAPLGQAAHARLMQDCAQRLQAVASATMRLYRSGEDGFVFLWAPARAADAPPAASEEPIPEPLLTALLSALREPFEIGAALPLHIEFGLGYACAPDHGRSAEELIGNAAMALAASKAAFNRPVGYDHALRGRIEHRHQLLRELHQALERDEFELHYQPQVDLGTGAVVALEALLRWRHPERGLLLPHAFLQVLSASALSVPVGEWVLRRACAQVATWNKRREAPLTVAVNVFPRQFDRDILPAAILRALAESGLPAPLLDIEITENITIDPATQAPEVFDALAATGVAVVLDDFGTGYASLTSLARHPVHKLKIDKSFVDGLGGGPGYRAILQAISTLATTLGLGTVVEGVETERTAALMREFGFRTGQGYLWGQPLPQEACAAALGLVG